MFLSIIIPYHNEDQSIIDPLLHSINGQIGIDFNNIEVIIVNDCENQNELNFSAYTNLVNLKYIVSSCKNNPGLSRQFGLDQAKGDFIMFCDSDDLLASCLVIKDSLSFIQQKQADIYHLDFLEEGIVDNQFTYLTKGPNITWVFGKIYRSAFLKDNNIRFSKKLMYHEDSYFNGLCVGCQARTLRIPITGYIWKFNQASITRKNNFEYTCKSCNEHIKSIQLVQDKYEIRGLKTMETQRILIQFFGLMYHNIHTIFKNSEYRQGIEQSLSELILKHDKNLLCLTEEWRPIVNLGIQQNFHMDFAPTELFEHFIQRIINEGEQK